eukprot:s4789_g3.t1
MASVQNIPELAEPKLLKAFRCKIFCWLVNFCWAELLFASSCRSSIELTGSVHDVPSHSSVHSFTGQLDLALSPYHPRYVHDGGFTQQDIEVFPGENSHIIREQC